MEAAHRKGIIHGDLKPNNVMLIKGADPLRVVVTDFGLARPATSSPHGTPATPGSPLFGALDYVAPELRSGSPKSAASDIFALGAILYELLSGARK